MKEKKGKGFICDYCGFNHGISICCTGFKQAIQSLFGGRKLNKKESIKMRNSKR